MERFDEVDQSGRQVAPNDSITPSGSHDAKSHNVSTTKQLPVGKPPSGGASKIDTHRVAGMLGL